VARLTTCCKQTPTQPTNNPDTWSCPNCRRNNPATHPDLNDKRLHNRRIPWKSLMRDGYNPHEVMEQAQREGEFRIAHRAQERARRKPTRGKTK